jgi:hypothetical protein
MKHWIFVLFLFVGQLAALRAEPFERAEVTKTINLVSLLPRDTRAVPGDIIKGDAALKTGGYSRAELQFPDLTITRVHFSGLSRAHARLFWTAAACCFPPRAAREEERCRLGRLPRRLRDRTF